MRVSPDQIDRIREASNIVDIVGEHVRLKKRGRNFTGLCPFHNEKTPSFNVLEDRGIFKCFGCGKGGDVFSFVMQLESLTFPETLQKLAKRANIELEGIESEAGEAIRSERESLLNALREAAAFFYRALRSPAGNVAMSFLRDRGFEDEIMRKFGLGFAPETSGQLTQQLKNQGFTEEKLEAAGLIGRRDNGELYERFRGRVMFPVFNATGRIAGFGGRVLPDAPAHLAKYINSPDTQVYHKSQILYGLFQAKDAIRRKGYAILVEGYADVLTVFQAGIENVVAASGTSLTTEQLQLLRRYVTNIVLLFDADTAGKNAAIRGIELAIEAGFDVNTVILPTGEDPDSFIRKNGREVFEAAIERRQSFIETKAQWFEEQGAFRDPGQMAGAIRSIVETIAKVPDAIKRPLFIHRLGERFHLSEQMLTIELEKLIAGRDRQEEAIKTREEILHDDEIESRDYLIHFAEDTPVPPPEAALLEAIIADPYGVAKLIDETEFDTKLMTHHVARELLGLLMQNIEGGELPEIAKLVSDYRGHPDYEKILIECGMSENTFSANWDQKSDGEETGPITQARHAIASMERAYMMERQKELWHKVRSAPTQDDLSVYLLESQKVAQRLEALRDYSVQ